MQNYFRKGFFVEIVLQIKRPFQDQSCFSVVTHVQLCKHSPYSLKTASNKEDWQHQARSFNTRLSQIFYKDFPKKKHISKIKRSLPDALQKYAGELTQLPSYVRCVPSNQVIHESNKTNLLRELENFIISINKTRLLFEISNSKCSQNE